MNIQLFQKKLSKISALMDSASEDNTLTSLEKDLLLSYVRDLYEIAIGVEKQPKKEVEEVSKTNMTTFDLPTPKIEVSPIEFVEEKIASISVDYPKEVSNGVATQSNHVSNNNIQEAVRPISDLPKIVQEPIATSYTQVSKTNPQIEGVEELFIFDKGSDLSDKFANTPIKDLTKCMGINERIFTQTELFANNPSALNDTLTHLNQCTNFNEAKQYLIDNVIPKYEWTSDVKSRKAATFIKLIYRKYI